MDNATHIVIRKINKLANTRRNFLYSIVYSNNEYCIYDNKTNMRIAICSSLRHAIDKYNPLHLRVAQFEKEKEEEIVVWMRMWNADSKESIIDQAIARFNLSETDAERIFLVAFPDGILSREKEEVAELDTLIHNEDFSFLDSLLDFVDIISGEITNISNVQVENTDYPNLDKAKNIIISLLENRLII